MSIVVVLTAASGLVDCAQCKESISLVQAASAAAALIRINGGKAAVSCICKQQLLALTVFITPPGRSQAALPCFCLRALVSYTASTAFETPTPTNPSHDYGRPQA